MPVRGSGPAVSGDRTIGVAAPGGGGPFQHLIDKPGDERRVHAGRRRPLAGQAQLGGRGRRLGVQIVDDFHVVGDESDGSDNKFTNTARMQGFDMV